MSLIIQPPSGIEIQTEKHTTQKEIGSKLYQALDIDDALTKAYEEMGKEILPIIIQSEESKVLELPWELLYHERFGFLATHPQFTLSRHIPNLPKASINLEKTPLRVLFFSTLPDDLEQSERLAVENEQVAVVQALLPAIKKGEVELQIPNDGRFESLKHHIEKFKPHLVFLSGHSVYHKGKGYFLFEDKRGFKTHVDEEKLTTAFIDSNVECVVLSSCQSAQAGDEMLNSGLARALAFRGISHVIGMSDSIYDKAGAVFAEHFITALANKKSVPLALQRGREAIKEIENAEIASHFFLPLLISQDIKQPLVDWDFEAKPPKREMTLQKFNQLVFPPLLIGRRKEFRQFYNRLYDNKLKKLLIFGEGGMGKSALVGYFGLKLRSEGYRVFDYSLKHGGDFEDFLFDMELELSEENARKYEKIKERCRDEACKAKRLVKLLLEENPKVLFIFDNLESVQNPSTQALEDETLKAWIEVLSETDDVVLLMTSRWLLPDCKESIQLGKPLKGDFLHYIALQNIDFSEKSKIDKIYNTLGGNYRGTEFFVKATLGMSFREEEKFLEKLSDATQEIQIDMAIEEILSHRTEEEIALLQRLRVYTVPIPREGVRKIALDLSKEALDVLVSFSLVEESFNYEYEENEYQVSALVLGFIGNTIKITQSIKELASEYQFYLFLYERKNLQYALLAHEALVRVNQVEKLDRWLFDEKNREDITLRGLVLGNLGHHYHGLAEYAKSLKYSEQSLKIRQEIGDKSGEGTTLNNISQIYDAQGDYPTALKYLEQSLKIRQEIGDKSGEGTTLNNISQIYDAQGDNPTALKYLEQSLKIRQEIGDKSGEGTTLNNISQIYDAQGDNPTALKYLEQSLKIQKEIGDKLGEGATLNNISQIYDAQGDNPTALKYLEQSLKIQKEIGDVSGLCFTLFNMGHIYLQNENIQEAVEAWVTVYQLAKQIGLAEVLNALEDLAGYLGLENGLEGWEALSQ